MSVSSGYPPLFQPSTVSPVSTQLMPLPVRPPRSWRDVVEAAWRQGPQVLAIGALGMAAALLLRAAQPPVYVATARVMLQPLPGVPTDGEPADAARGLADAAALLRDRRNAEDAVARLVLDPSAFAVRTFAGVPVGPGAREPADRASERAVTVERLLGALQVEPRRLRDGGAGAGADLLEVRLAATDPVVASRALQALLDQYRRLSAVHDRETARGARQDLEARLALAAEGVRRSDAAIVALLVRDPADALSDHPTGAGPAGSGAPAAGPALRVDTEPGATGARPGASSPVVDGMAAAAEVPPIAPALRLDDDLALPDDEFVPPGVSPERDRERDRDRDRARSGDDTPSPRPLVRSESPFGAQFARLERQRSAALAQRAALRRQLDRVEAAMRPDAVGAASVLLVEAPVRPTSPVARRMPGLLPAGAMLGLLLGLAWALARELGADRLRSAREVRWALGAPLLGALPTLPARARHALVGPSLRSSRREPPEEAEAAAPDAAR